MMIAKRLNLLREEMRQQKMDIYLIPSTDAHNSEYVPECWLRRPWISGFDGSAGEVVVTLDHAYLWTDGRYFLQAEEQLDLNCFSLMKQSGFTSEIEQWLVSYARNKRVGIDPRLVGIARVLQLQKIMHSISGEVVVFEDNLIDHCKLKSGEKVILPTEKAFALSEEYTGYSINEKLRSLRNDLTVQLADYIALNVLDEIAWLFNMRGSDIDFNPLVISYAIVGQKDAWLFIDEQKISTELRLNLVNAGVKIVDYSLFGEILHSLNGSIWLDDKTASYWMLLQAQQNAEVIFARSPIVLKKSCKNQQEVAGSKHAHIKDAVAVINFLYWLENNWQAGVDEIKSAEKLAEFRGQQQNIKGSSFATISGFAANGAIIHYRATPETSKIINDSSLYLLDSGGQYLEGTTDITRTIHLGMPEQIHKRHYTLVLKGHLALARAKFPEGTCGEHLDALARMPLWGDFLNYRHGTGHGVGSFLCVHEGPQRISPGASGVSLLPGMIVSNEPGVYFDGAYGIRIENLCVVTEVAENAAKNSVYGAFYQFEDLTLVPYCKKLIDISLLNAEEILQLQNYYTKIKTNIAPLLETKQQCWLDEQLSIF